jgi:GNAT superfamily N-acetyltransferase
MACEGYEIDDDPNRVDQEGVWRYLSTEAYWTRWRSKEDVRRQVSSAWRVVGCYSVSGAMVGFARAVSDGVTIAYLADVYVLREHRGRGLATALLTEMIDNGPGHDFIWMLHTRDAHGLYRKAGFADPDERYLERPGRRR